jgi:hypothetical protein
VGITGGDHRGDDHTGDGHAGSVRRRGAIARPHKRHLPNGHLTPDHASCVCNRLIFAALDAMALAALTPGAAQTCLETFP